MQFIPGPQNTGPHFSQFGPHLVWSAVLKSARKSQQFS